MSMTTDALSIPGIQPFSIDSLTFPGEVDAADLGATLVSLAIGGASGTLFSEINQIEPESTLPAIREVSFLYLHLAALEIQHEMRGDGDALIEQLFATVRADLLDRCFGGDDEGLVRAFDRDFDRCQRSYALCRRIYRPEGGSFEGTILGEFFKRIAPLSQETRVCLFAGLQIGQVRDEVRRALRAPGAVAIRV